MDEFPFMFKVFNGNNLSVQAWGGIINVTKTLKKGKQCGFCTWKIDRNKVSVAGHEYYLNVQENVQYPVQQDRN